MGRLRCIAIVAVCARVCAAKNVSIPWHDYISCENSFYAVVGASTEGEQAVTGKTAKCPRGSEVVKLFCHAGFTGFITVCIPRICSDADVEDLVSLKVSAGGCKQWSEPVWSTRPAARASNADRLAPSLPKTSVAVCIDGPAYRAGPSYVARRYALALDGLGADLHVFAIAGAKDGPECETGKRIYEDAFRENLKGYICNIDQPVEELRADFLSQVPNVTWWHENEWRFNFCKTCGFDTLLRNLRMKSNCFSVVAGMERTLGKEYPWIVYLRNDYDFFAPHPPLAFMSLVGGVWVPDGDDHWGLNDRWAVVERTHAPAYFKRWEAYVAGAVVPYLQREFRLGRKVHNAESLLMLHLHRHHIWPRQVHRFMPTASMRCYLPRGRKNCEASSFLVRSRGWRGRIDWANAYGTAQRLRHDGWAWALSPPRVFSPVCPAAAECCKDLPLGGSQDCFDPVFRTYSRCCSRNKFLSIIPDPQGASTLPRCWQLHGDYIGPMIACIPNVD